ncbi:MAG: exodeoxyribonuclease V subunit gamma [Candidatus Omnitrophica bacterium]|nr:exodeoxyribonuclease V subunit gamma [Candidatus Omnitrophota bacterium]
MSRQLIIGPAGSGKTHDLIQDFEKTLSESQNPLEEDFFFIVPSREHTERIVTLMVQRGIKGFFHRRVTTLPDLVMRLFGIPEEGVATNVTRYLILKDILKENEWETFRGIQESSGFLNLILAFIQELKESLISVDVFRARTNDLKRLEPELAPKYEALAVIYEAYETAFKARGLRDRQDALTIYRSKEKPPTAYRLRKVWLDGFFDFSEVQFGYLEELSKRTDEMKVTLTYDPSPHRRELFEAVLTTKEAFEQMGFEILNKKLPPSAAKAGFQNRELAYLENHLFSSSLPKQKMKPPGHIQVFEAIGMEGELEMIARSIQKQHRLGDYRFSDFALLLRQIGDYEQVIRSVFGRYKIPFEIHERERLNFAPLMQVFGKLLKIFRDGWRKQDLTEFLKSSYVRTLGGEAKDYEWVSRLEHRAMELGIFRKRENWFAPWDPKSCGKDFNTKKAKGLQDLADLEDSLARAKTISEIKIRLIEAARKTFGIFQRFDSSEEYVRRDAASYKRFLAILDEIDVSYRLPGRSQAGIPVTLESFMDRFFRLLDLDLFSLPERDKNKVQIYDVSMARQKEYKVVYLAGLLEKRFPVQMKENPVLSDWERQLFNGTHKSGILKLQLPRQRMERYLFYLAVTRAKEKLFLSYPRLDLEGKESLPSYYLEEAEKVFDGPLVREKQDLSRPYPKMESLVNERELEMALLGEFFSQSPSKRETSALRLFLFNEVLKNKTSQGKIRRAFYEIKTELTDEKILEKDPFKASKTSATGLEDYAKCPFKYYARRVLALNDPEEDVNIFRRGLILHEVLEHFFRAAKKDPRIFGKLEEIRDLLSSKLEEALKEFPLVLDQQYRMDLELEDLREMLERFVETEIERLKDSPLKPEHFELDFGGPGSKIPPLVLQDGKREILIRGKIDRVDADPRAKVGAVLDYKRTASFKRGELDLGVALQLPLYSLVLKEILKLEVAGAELYSIKKCEKSGFYRSDYLNYFPGVTARRMVLKEKEFEDVLSRCVEFVLLFSSEMKVLKMPVRPRQCDSFCPYSSVCRIEKWRLPLILEEIREEDKKRREETKEHALTK